MSGPSSLAPAAQEVVKEAKSTRFQISLLLLSAIVGGAYWVGRDSARGVAEAQIETLKTVQDERLGQLVDALKAQAEISRAGYQDVATEARAARRDIGALKAEIEVVKSHVSR